jgi:hypothetical protein
MYLRTFFIITFFFGIMRALFINKILFFYCTIHSHDIFNVEHPFIMIIRAPLLAKFLNKTCKRYYFSSTKICKPIPSIPSKTM